MTEVYDYLSLRMGDDSRWKAERLNQPTFLSNHIRVLSRYQEQPLNYICMETLLNEVQV